MSKTRIETSSNADSAFDGMITNTLSTPSMITFRRTANLPAGWTTSICFGTNCFASSIDTTGQTFGAGESQGLVVHVIPTLGEVADSGTLYLKLYSASGNPADTVLLVFKVVYHPGNPPLIFRLDDSHVRWSVIGKGQKVFSPMLYNFAGTSVMYHVWTDAVHTPAGWSNVFCVVDSCPGAHDAWQSLGAAFSDSYSAKVKCTMQAPTLVERDSVVFYMHVRPQTPNPADSMIYRFCALMNDQYFTHPATQTFTGAGVHADTCSFTNYSTAAAVYHFSMETKMPAGWSAALSVGDTSTNGTDLRASFGADASATAQQGVVVKFTTLPVTAKDSATALVHFYKESNPADSGTLVFTDYVLPGAGVSPTVVHESRAGLAVTNVWPNPVMGASTLNLEVLSDEQGEAVARIYDIAGNETANLRLGTLTRGSNHITLNQLGMTSGEYVIVIEQAGVLSDPIRINYVK